MTTSDIFNVVVGGIEGLGAITVFLLVLLVGVCVLLTLTKFRSTRNSLTVKSLDELVGEPIHYLPPTTPHGQTDQLARFRS